MSSSHKTTQTVLHDHRVHTVAAVLLLALTLWLTSLMANDYSAADLSVSKYPKVISYVHTKKGRVLVCALWLIVGLLVCKCLCHHMEKK